MFLSPNHRLALYAARKYHKKVYPFAGWVEGLWQMLKDQNNDSEINKTKKTSETNEINETRDTQPQPFQTIPKLLNSLEQVTLFEEIINHSTTLDYPLLRREATAKLAKEAWDLCLQWELSYQTLKSYAHTEDHHAYLQWSKAYQEKCQKNNWLNTADLLNYVGEAIKNNSLILPEKITCLGFMEWTPQQTRLLKLCEDKGCRIEMQSLLEAAPLDISRIAFANEEEELKLALCYAKSWLIKNSKAQIGIIIPDLEQKRFAVLRILEEVCHPKEYNVAAPIPLAQYPMIDAALMGLGLMQAEIPFEDLSKIFRLAFLGGTPEEMCLTAQLEIQLRSLVRGKHILSEYVIFLESILKRCPKLQACSIVAKLKNCLALKPAFFGKKTPEAWKNLLVEFLACLGWPGTRILNEEEKALKQHWETLLDDYCNMEAVLSQHSYAEALKQLRRLASNRQFLPQSHQSSIDAPIQVLGLLEGLGFPFDFLWVVGLYRDAWPKEPAANPFIPLVLQTMHQLPRSSATRELEVAERMTQELSCGGNKVIFSYPKVVAEQATCISPLITHFPEITVEEILGVGSTIAINMENEAPQIIKADIHTEKIYQQNQKGGETEDHQDFLEQDVQTDQNIQKFEWGPASPENESAVGGTKILALQAVCPFRAFAEIRLKAEPLINPAIGLTAAERGEIIHQVLVIFWQALKNQAALLALTDEQRHHRIEQAIHIVFEQKRKSHASFFSSSSFTERYLELERNRILDLVQRFLVLEASRPPFEVLAHEVPEELILGGIRLKLRIDRIDKLENGDELLIDYKTGQVQVSEWFGERPLAPQLPLYCIARKQKASAVAFAIIKPDEVRYRGLRVDHEEDIEIIIGTGVEDEIEDGTGSRAATINRTGKNEIGNATGNGTKILGIDTATKMKRYGAEETWELQKSVWENHLEKLAQEFKEGKAVVTPLKGEQSCRSCHLKSLCRVGFPLSREL